MPLAGSSIREILMRPAYAPCAQVLLQWLVFGPSGHRTRPDGLVIESYTSRLPEAAEASRHIKSIVRADKLCGIDYTPHAAECSGPACNSRGETVLPYAIQPTKCHEVMVVNHYFTKSRDDWEFKRRRGRGELARALSGTGVLGRDGRGDHRGRQGAALRPAAAGAAAVLINGRTLDRRRQARRQEQATTEPRIMDKIAICAIFKDEAPYLLEWIAFHRMIGVDLFVLYDNGSSDGGPDLIRRSSFARNVTLIEWSDRPGQIPAYQHFHEPITLATSTWAAFIDLDEFIMPVTGSSIRDILIAQGVCAVLRYPAAMADLRAVRPRPAARRTGDRELSPGVCLKTSDANRHVKSLVRSKDLTQHRHHTAYLRCAAAPPATRAAKLSCPTPSSRSPVTT